MAIGRDDRPMLMQKARLVRDRATGRDMLLYPERGLVLNAVAAAVAARLDGSRTVAGIAAEVAALFEGADAAEVERDVAAFLEALASRALLDGLPDRPRPIASPSPAPR